MASPHNPGIELEKEPLSTELKGGLIRLGVLNNLGSAVTLLTGLVMVPVMLGGLGSPVYGVWIMIISVSGLIMSADLGLGLIVTREVAITRRSATATESPAARSAGGALMLVGVGGLAAMILAGLIAERASLSSQASNNPWLLVFMLVGVALFAEQIVQYCLAVLGAHMRFGLTNSILGGGTLLRAALIVVALVLNSGVTGVAIAYAIGSGLTAAAAASVLARVDGRHALHNVRFDWLALRPQLRFGLLSLIATLAGAALWQIHPLMLGLMAGPATVVAFFVGIRLPMLVSEISWRTAEVMFPAVSAEADPRNGDCRTAIILSAGVRWLMMLVLPLAAMGFVLAPSILAVWLPEVPDSATTVLRLGMVVILLDALAVAAMQVLWGLGKSGSLAAIMGAAAMVTIALNFLLIPMYGPVAAILAMIAGLSLVTSFSLWIAAGKAGLSLSSLLMRDVVSLLPAGLACAAAATLGAWPIQGSGHVWQLTLGAVFGIVAYAIAIMFTKSVAEERIVLRKTLAMMTKRIKESLRFSRSRAKKVDWLRSAWYLLIVMRRRLAYRSPSTSASLDELFEATPDPWHYTSTEEQERHAIAAGLLAHIEDSDAFKRALEIGCAEGAFTRRLAGMCQSLLAVDVSENALKRARLRCALEGSVSFARLDLLRDQIAGRFTLVVVMDVLTYFESVSQLRAIRDKIFGVIEHGGWLLVGDVRQSEVYETSWWGRRLLCGGRWICEFMASHPQLTEVSRVETDTHILILLRKTS